MGAEPRGSTGIGAAQVEYVFTDKTGTSPRNNMEFRSAAEGRARPHAVCAQAPTPSSAHGHDRRSPGASGRVGDQLPARVLPPPFPRPCLGRQQGHLLSRVWDRTTPVTCRKKRRGCRRPR